MNVKQLERLALAHHAAGGRWNDFWAMHGDHVRAAVGCWDRSGFRRLYQKLLSLVVAGDCDGQVPPGDAPWEVDDALEAKASDTGTRAKLQNGVFDQ